MRCAQVYTIYSILSIVFLILIIVTAFITVALTYFQLAVEDHRWWWRSFLNGGSTGGLPFTCVALLQTITAEYISLHAHVPDGVPCIAGNLRLFGDLLREALRIIWAHELISEPEQYNLWLQ